MISLCYCIRATVQILAKQGLLLLLSPGPQTFHKMTLKLLPFLIAQRLLIARKFADASARGTIYCSTQRWPVGQRAGWACCSHGRMFSESFHEGTRRNSVFTAYAVFMCRPDISWGPFHPLKARRDDRECPFSITLRCPKPSLKVSGFLEWGRGNNFIPATLLLGLHFP